MHSPPQNDGDRARRRMSYKPPSSNVRRNSFVARHRNNNDSADSRNSRRRNGRDGSGSGNRRRHVRNFDDDKYKSGRSMPRVY